VQKYAKIVYEMKVLKGISAEEATTIEKEELAFPLLQT
jgi:hypothetical protein